MNLVYIDKDGTTTDDHRGTTALVQLDIDGIASAINEVSRLGVLQGEYQLVGDHDMARLAEEAGVQIAHTLISHLEEIGSRFMVDNADSVSSNTITGE